MTYAQVFVTRHLANRFEDDPRKMAGVLPNDMRLQIRIDLKRLQHSNVHIVFLIMDRSAEAKLRCTACWIVGNAKYKESIKALLFAFEDRNTKLQWQSAISLASIGSKRAVLPFIQALKSPSIEKRMAAVYALGILRDSRAVTPLLKILLSKNEPLALWGHAAEALWRFNTSIAIQGLRKALGDDDAVVRFWASYSLGQLGDMKALPLLRKLAKSDHRMVTNFWEVSAEAQSAIDKITSSRR